MSFSFGLLCYQFVTAAVAPFAPLILKRRMTAGKEDPERLAERLGHAAYPRPDGPVIWFHGASVGESLALLELMDYVRHAVPQATLLITTGTRTSADMLPGRLPPDAIHQYLPLDMRPSIKRFLDHWKPDLVLWSESDLWPNMLRAIKRRSIPAVLVNARMSRESVAKWQRAPRFARNLLDPFSAFLTQTQDTAEQLIALGAPQAAVTMTGTLKGGAKPLQDDPPMRADLSARMGARRRWCAASTHPGEETLVAEAHRKASAGAPNLLLVLVPRHPDRGADIAHQLRSAGWDVACRSQGEPLQDATQIYLADTLGELGLWYRLCPVSFVGGSLVPIGGHNPYEPALLGSGILFGPHVENFATGYDALRAVSGGIEVEDAASLAEAVTATLDPAKTAEMTERARDICAWGEETMGAVVTAINPFLETLRTQDQL